MTPDRAALESLLERVRAAKWADRELDGLIIVAVGAASEVNPHSPTFVRMLDRRGRPDDIYCRSAEVTSSLDAAVDLIDRVLPGAHWDVQAGGCAWIRVDDADIGDAWNLATPALALCAALLTAILARAGDD